MEGIRAVMGVGHPGVNGHHGRGKQILARDFRSTPFRSTPFRRSAERVTGQVHVEHR